MEGQGIGLMELLRNQEAGVKNPVVLPKLSFIDVGVTEMFGKTQEGKPYPKDIFFKAEPKNSGGNEAAVYVRCKQVFSLYGLQPISEKQYKEGTIGAQKYFIC